LRWGSREMAATVTIFLTTNWLLVPIPEMPKTSYPCLFAEPSFSNKQNASGGIWCFLLHTKSILTQPMYQKNNHWSKKENWINCFLWYIMEW
jgi:hypothetical protein